MNRYDASNSAALDISDFVPTAIAALDVASGMLQAGDAGQIKAKGYHDLVTDLDVKIERALRKLWIESESEEKSVAYPPVC